FEVEHVFETIGRKVMMLNARRLRQGPGADEMILVVIEDATDRRDAEDARRDAETRFTEMVKNVRDHSIFLTDPDGVITSWNVAAERVIGYTEAEAVGKHFSLIFTPEDLRNGLPEWELRTAREEGRSEDEGWHVRKGGGRFWALGIVTPLRDPGGRLTGFSKILRDMTERKHAEEAMREGEGLLKGQKEAFEAAVGGAPLEACLDVLLRTVTERAGGGTRAAFYVVDEGASCLRPVSTAGGMPEAYTRQVDGFRIGRNSFGCGLAAEAGSPVITRDVFEEPLWASWLPLAREFDFRGCWSFPIETHAGAPVGTFAMYHREPREAAPRDLALASAITQAAAIIISRHTEAQERKRAEAALRASEERLRESEERLRVALAAGQMGTWLWRIPQDEQVIDDSLRRLMGLPPGAEVMNLGVFLQAVHEDDRARTREEFERCLGGGDFNVEFRVTWPDGSTHWLKDQGKVFPSPDGRASFMAGAAMDITERRRMEEELRDADRRKDDFLALLAHELRNPLAPIRNGLQVIRLSGDRETRERSQAMMDRQLTHMVRLIDDLLDVSRINRGKMELRRSRILLADALSSAVETARPVIEAAGHELTTDLPADPVTLDADLTRLAQVFSNLLTNSAKYTERGGRIALAARRDGAEVVVTVTDTGIGIPAEALPRIFDMFSQVDRSIERNTGGLGIGLALVKGLVEMHGGTVAAASGGQGRGSEFTVRLPASTVRPGNPGDVPAAPSGTPSGPGRRILVVDDNRDSAQSMGEMLRLFGHQVAFAYDGLEAVERAGAFRPEAILMDVGMPRLNGYEATRRIREQPWGRGMSIIALTGWGQEGDRSRSKDAGCDGHLVKPVSLSELERVLKDVRAGA
ncbi:MAG TPA: PAS domain S-box protein, partial [Urbifossiella sp.]|nr:PAS domain S-box protein [Urbifossiella sp.]